MITLSDLARVQGRPAYDSSGQPLGTVDQIYMSDYDDQPRWVTVTGAPGSAAQLFAPVAGARVEGDGLRLAWPRADVLGSPQVAPDEHIDAAMEARLAQYYGGGQASGHDAAGLETGLETGLQTGLETGQRTENGTAPDPGVSNDARITLSAERAVPGTRQVSRRLRLHRYVDTEVEIVEVPLKRERLRIERVSDVDGTTQLLDEITLREERILEVRTETVQLEHVRVTKTVVEEEERLAIELAREHLHIESAAIDGGAATDR